MSVIKEKRKTEKWRRRNGKKKLKTHQRGRAGPGLGLHDLRAGVLDALGHGRGVGLGERDLGRGLREEREDGGPGVAADDGDVDVGDVEALGLLHFFFFFCQREGEREKGTF